MNSNAPNKDPLDDLLKSWRVDAPLPPGFERNVWRRIDQSRDAQRPAVWETVANWISNGLARPALAGSYIAVLVLIGVGVGWGHAQQDSAQLKQELGQRYVQVLDPYLSTHP